MQKKNFAVKVSRAIKEFVILNITATGEQKAKHIAEYQAEENRADTEFGWQDDPASLPGKITTEIVEDDLRTPSDSDE